MILLLHDVFLHLLPPQAALSPETPPPSIQVLIDNSCQDN